MPIVTVLYVENMTAQKLLNTVLNLSFPILELANVRRSSEADSQYVSNLLEVVLTSSPSRKMLRVCPEPSVARMANAGSVGWAAKRKSVGEKSK